MRADKFISQALNISRNQALELILSGSVMADDKLITKASQDLNDENITLVDDIFVGRGALKLRSFLQDNNIKVDNLDAIDIGSSTGGFMQVLLNFGVKSVIGVDVGKSQISDIVLADKRASVKEGTDIRILAKQFYNQNIKFNLITCDVSFISLKEIITYIDLIAEQNSTIITLFKPQFEVGREVKRNKKGVVKDEKAIQKAIYDFKLDTAKLGWRLKVLSPSKIAGKEGNVEYFFAFKK